MNERSQGQTVEIDRRISGLSFGGIAIKDQSTEKKKKDFMILNDRAETLPVDKLISFPEAFLKEKPKDEIFFNFRKHIVNNLDQYEKFDPMPHQGKKAIERLLQNNKKESFRISTEIFKTESTQYKQAIANKIHKNIFQRKISGTSATSFESEILYYHVHHQQQQEAQGTHHQNRRV